jgi:hypothetical protein
MKKVLPILMLLAIFGLSNSIAQTNYDSTSFESGALPTGWTATPANHWVIGPWYTNANFPANPHTKFAVISDSTCSCSNSAAYLTTGVINLNAATTVLLKFDYLWEEWYTNTTNETFEVDYSTDGGTTWTAMIYPNPVGAWTTVVANISGFVATQANVKIRFAYGDMGTEFPDGGAAIDNFYVYTPIAFDVSETSIDIPTYVQDNTPFIVHGIFENIGATSVSSLKMNYSVNGGPTQSQTLTGLNVQTLDSYNYTLNAIPYTPTSNAGYTIKVWNDTINSTHMDPTPANDTLSGSFTVIDTVIQKVVLVEEFNQASCDPCAEAAANVDSVIYGNYNVVAPVRYHVSWPGVDYMNAVPIIGTDVQTRVQYYNVTGVPDARIDGSTDAYPGYDPNAVSLSTSVIQPLSQKGSPFRLNVNATYDGVKQFNITTTIKAFTAMPALKFFVALTDSLHYASNQSSESIPQYDFPEAMEQMLPTVAGTSLTAFAAEGIQTVTTNWTQNHPLATNSLPYDSGQWRVVVWVQNTATKYVYQAAQIIPTLMLGIDEISNVVGSFSVYPNPVETTANVSFTLKNPSNVTMDVYTLVGEKVYSQDFGTLGNGINIVPLETKGLSAGMYFVTLSAGGNRVTQKVTIQK